MKKVFIEVLCFLVFAFGISFAQDIRVHGVVKSSVDTEPLIGVTVFVKGGVDGVTTDFDGMYEIVVSKGTTLVYSYVGMDSQEVLIQSSAIADAGVTDKEINITLVPSDESQLDEIVVTGLGIERSEKSLTFSAPVVVGEDITAAQNTNVMSALSGKVSGVSINSPSGNIGGSQRILIRGANSISGENQPLFVIDGVPMDNSNFNSTSAQRGSGGVDYGSMMNDINPDDVESVVVLKGTAAAIYGSRASNGVILITTKKGKKGDNKDRGARVSFNSSAEFSNVYVLPKQQRLYGGGGVDSIFNKYAVNGKIYDVPQYATDESWGPKFDPNVHVLHWDAFDKESFPEDYLKPRPWIAPANDVRSFFNTGFLLNNSVSISSGSEKGSSVFSLAHSGNKGVVPNTEIEKINASLRLNRKISKKFSFNSGMNYVRTNGKRLASGYTGSGIINQMFQFGQVQVDYDRLKNYKNKDGSQRTWNRTSASDGTPKYADNPYWTVNENFSTDQRDRFYGNTSLTYNVMEGLNIKGSLYADTYSFRMQQRQAMGSQDQSYYQETKINFYEVNQEIIATYDKDITSDIKLNAMLGANRRMTSREVGANETSGGLSMPGIYNIKNGLGNLTPSLAYTRDKNVSSVFATANIGYKDQVFLDLTARNDWSSTLPESNNSYFYPSIAGSWIFTDTFSDMIPESIPINYGKLRLGWSQVGNDTGAYNAKDNYVTKLPIGGQGVVDISNTKRNNDLKSETTTTFEVGTELNFFNSRFNIDATYYASSTTDQILPIRLSISSGYNYKYLNSGKMTNEGVELLATITPVINSDFRWDITANFTKNVNKLEELIIGNPNFKSIVLSGAAFRAQVAAYKGQSYGVIMGTDFVYDGKGNKVVDNSKDEEIRGRYLATEDLVPLGSVLPDYTLGITNSFSYKNMDFSFLIDTSQGGKYFSLTHMWGTYSGMLEHTATNGIREKDEEGEKIGLVLPGVKKEGDNYVKNDIKITAKRYGKSHYGGVDAQNVFDASYIKLREIKLGYTFPKGMIPFVESVKVGAYGRNLFVWGLAYDGIDPETVSTGSGNIQGLEGGSFPSVRNYGINLKVVF